MFILMKKWNIYVLMKKWKKRYENILFRYNFRVNIGISTWFVGFRIIQTI